MSASIPSLERGADLVCRSAAALAQLCLAVMAVLVSVEVVCRSALGFSLLIVDEMAGYLLVSVVFLGLGATFRGGHLLRIAAAYDRLPPRLRPALDLLFDLSCLVFTGILFWQLCRLLGQSYDRNVTSVTLMATPLWMPQLAMCVGAGVFLVAVAASFLGSAVRACRSVSGPSQAS